MKALPGTISTRNGKVPPDLSPFWFKSWLLYVLMKVSALEPVDMQEAFIMTVTGMEDAGALLQGEGLNFLDTLREAAEGLAEQGYLVINSEKRTIRMTDTGMTVSRMVVPPGISSRESE